MQTKETVEQVITRIVEKNNMFWQLLTDHNLPATERLAIVNKLFPNSK